MRFFFLILFTCITHLILFGCVTVHAHPLDVSNTIFTIYDSTIEWVTYIHPVQIDRILIKTAWVQPGDLNVDTYYRLQNKLGEYLRETIQVTNWWTYCTMSDFAIQDWLMIDEIFVWWFPISYTFRCDTNIHNPHISITFCNDVPLQTNRLTLYTRSSHWDLEKADYKILNNKKTSHVYDSDSGKVTMMNDSDWDWINNEDEVLYGTNPNSPDSDNDWYNDGIELQSSWNPVDSSLSPWQQPYDRERVNTTEQQVLIHKNNQNDAQVWWGAIFTEVLKKIRMYIDNSWWNNVLYLILIVGFLWFIHALGPGHSKWILIAQVLDQGMSIPRIIMYSFVFSIIHILDIVLVVIVSRYFLGSVDPSKYLPLIQQISIVLIIAIGITLLLLAIKRYLSPRIKDQSQSNNHKHHIILAIITGITPCAFWWSIFLMLLSTGNTYLAIPLLVSLWFGIFACLVIVWLTTYFGRQKIYVLAPNIGSISPIISSSIIILIGLWLSATYL